MKRSASTIIVGTIIATTGMALLWQEASTDPKVGMTGRDVTWSDNAPTPTATATPEPTPAPTRAADPKVGTTPGNVKPPTYVPTLTPREAWAACVVHALTTPGMGGDADMTDCDDAYYWATGLPADLWLYCPGAPEQGGCLAQDGDNARIPPPHVDAPDEPEVWEENPPTPTTDPNLGTVPATPEASPEAEVTEPLEGELNA